MLKSSALAELFFTFLWAHFDFFETLVAAFAFVSSGAVRASCGNLLGWPARYFHIR